MSPETTPPDTPASSPKTNATEKTIGSTSFTFGMSTSAKSEATASAVKTATTPHDLTVCFIECIKQGAKAFGLSLTDVGAAMAQMADQAVPPIDAATRPAGLAVRLQPADDHGDIIGLGHICSLFGIRYFAGAAVWLR